MADTFDETELRENIAEIIKNGDLATLTSKKIRQILEKKYGATLLHRKKQIDDIVMQLVDEQSGNSDDDASAESPSKSDSGKKSPKEESSEQETKLPVKSERKKKAKDESESDEEVLQSESESESDEEEKPKRKSAMKRSRSKNKERSKAAKKPKTEKGEGVKKKTGFSMPMLLSPDLAALMGETHMARSEVVKKMWQIIKERDLLDPTNKRYTICDEQLEKIIGQRRFMTFAMMKYLKKHVIDPSQIQ